MSSGPRNSPCPTTEVTGGSAAADAVFSFSATAEYRRSQPQVSSRVTYIFAKENFPFV